LLLGGEDRGDFTEGPLRFYRHLPVARGKQQLIVDRDLSVSCCLRDRKNMPRGVVTL
jgi:hypothetical protein